jgi:hypothetical protein
MKLLSAEARKATAAATSSTCPMRPMAIRAPSFALNAAEFSSPTSSVIPDVSVGPGEMAFTRIPRSLSSFAQARTNVRRAALDAA